MKFDEEGIHLEELFERLVKSSNERSLYGSKDAAAPDEKDAISEEFLSKKEKEEGLEKQVQVRKEDDLARVVEEEKKKIFVEEEEEEEDVAYGPNIQVKPYEQKNDGPSLYTGVSEIDRPIHYKSGVE
jgi:hypothetical protein